MKKKSTALFRGEGGLSFLKNCTNLEKLYLGNFTNHEDEFFRHYGEEKKEKDNMLKDFKHYNRFSGSLKDLKELKNLKILDISNTDVNIGDHF